MDIEQKIHQTTEDELHSGWELYFPEEVYDSNEHELHLQLIIRALEFFFRSDSFGSKVIATGEFPISFNELVRGFQDEIDLGALLVDKPSFALNCLDLALYMASSHVVKASQKRALLVDLDNDSPLGIISAPPAFNISRKMHIRLLDMSPTTPLRKLKSNMVGKLVAIRGTVIRVGIVRPIVTRMAFLCGLCHVSFDIELVDGKYKPPTSCAQSPHCRSRIFLPDRSNTKTVDFQSIRIQEKLHDESSELGRMPRTVEVELTGSLVDNCVPGDIAAVIGQVKVMNTQETVGSGKILDPNRSMFVVYLDANSLQTSKRNSSQPSDADASLDKLSYGQSLSFSDLYAIREISQQPHLFKLLLSSLAPGIFGHHLVKAGLLLALFGGVSSVDPKQHKTTLRGDLHVLIVGDPGLGKSQMLRAAHAVAPRGVFVCGSHSTDTGLTVSLLREKGSSDFSLEAGALVLADQGVCCVDEFDKIGKHHASLLEAMEQQSISIAKAGIICSLPARCSVLAAANPIGGHYTRSKTVSENIGMTSAILSRFDLIFILLDTPDSAFDQRMSDHVLGLHSSDGSRMYSQSCTLGSDAPLTGHTRAPEEPFVQYLQRSERTHKDLIPAFLLRKYIGYARQYCRPMFTPEASAVLKSYFLEMRKSARRLDTTPVTTRQLESLVRLSEARARCELRDIVTKEDAQDVVDLMQETRTFVEDDGIGISGFSPSIGDMMTGKMSKQKLQQLFVTKLRKEVDMTGKSEYTMSELRQFARKINLNIDQFDALIEALNSQSYLLNRGGKYQLYK